MNTKLIAGIGIAAIVIIAIVVFSFNRNSSPSMSDTSDSAQTQEEANGTAAEYLRAFEGNGSVKCTYDHEGTTGTAYVKNGRVRFEATANGTTSNSIMVDKVVYSWQTGQTTGMMMDTSKIEANVTPGAEQNIKSMEDVKRDLDAYQPQCASENIPDSTFDLPQDVEFTDMSKMMEDIKSQIPANVTIPEGFEIPQQ